MDVTSSRAADQLQPGSQTAPILRDPAQLLRLYAEHDRDTSFISSHISERNEEKRPEGGVIEKAAFVRLLKVDSLVVGSPSHGKPPKGRGKRGVINGLFPSRRSLAEVSLLLGNCEPEIKSMITATMTDVVHALFSVETHRQVVHAFCVLLGRRGFKDYCLVREFQENGSVHWHFFVAKAVDDSGLGGKLESVDLPLSQELSKCFARLYAKRTKCPLCKSGKYDVCEALNGACILGESFRRMTSPHCEDFLGCVRAERMRCEAAAARYAAKEGSKRFQKRPTDRRWREGGGAWCRHSRGFTIPEFGDVMVSVDELAIFKGKAANGFEIEAPYRIQHGRGINGSNPLVD